MRRNREIIGPTVLFPETAFRVNPKWFRGKKVRGLFDSPQKKSPDFRFRNFLAILPRNNVFCFVFFVFRFAHHYCPCAYVIWKFLLLSVFLWPMILWILSKKGISIFRSVSKLPGEDSRLQNCPFSKHVRKQTSTPPQNGGTKHAGSKSWCFSRVWWLWFRAKSC